MSTQEGGTMQQAREKGQEVVSQAQQQVQEKAHEAKGQMGSQLRTQVDQRSTQAGEQVQSFAGTMRRTAGQLREEGNSGQARFAEGVADRVERFGGYLAATDADSILSDVEHFARRRPWVVAGGAAVLGLLASRFLKASGQQRHDERYGLSSYGSTPYEPAYGRVPPARIAPAYEPVGTGAYSSGNTPGSGAIEGTDRGGF